MRQEIVNVPAKKFDALFEILFKKLDECQLSEFLHERLSQAIARTKRDIEQSGGS